MNIRSKAVLDTARGALCSFRFPGICGGDPATTVWAHLNGARFGKGAAMKAHDILGAHACFQCHAYLDTGHGTRPLISNETLLECVLGGVTETWVRLIVSGVITIPLDAPKPASERPTPKRKDKSQRQAIQSRPMPNTGRPIPSRQFTKPVRQ